MRDINKIVIRGAVSDRPRSRTFPDGATSVSATVITDTESPDSPDHRIRYWHRITAGGSLADPLGRLEEGDRVYIEGHLRHYEWTDKNGVQRPGTEIRPVLFRGPLPREPEHPESYDLHYVLLLGVAGRGRQSQGGERSLISLGIGTQPSYTRRDGKPPETVWHNVVRFGADHLPPSGSRICVQGACRSRQFKNRAGVDLRRTEILAGDLFLLTEFSGRHGDERPAGGRNGGRRDPEEDQSDGWGRRYVNQGRGQGEGWP